MAREFKETAHLKTDLKKLHENWDQIDWGKPKSIREVIAHSKQGQPEESEGMVQVCGLWFRPKVAEKLLKALEESE